MMMIAKNGNKAPLQPLEDTQRGSKLVRIGLFPTPQTTTMDPVPPQDQDKNWGQTQNLETQPIQ